MIQPEQCDQCLYGENNWPTVYPCLDCRRERIATGGDRPFFEPLPIDLFGLPLRDQVVRRRDLAHAAPPGSGPAGETCGSCGRMRVSRLARCYFKCGLVRSSCGPATDIRKRDSACRFWMACKADSDAVQPALSGNAFRLENSQMHENSADSSRKLSDSDSRV